MPPRIALRQWLHRASRASGITPRYPSMSGSVFFTASDDALTSACSDVAVNDAAASNGLRRPSPVISFVHPHCRVPLWRCAFSRFHVLRCSRDAWFAHRASWFALHHFQAFCPVASRSCCRDNAVMSRPLLFTLMNLFMNGVSVMTC